jgi:hypothetical protein
MTAKPVALLFADSHLQYPGAWASRPAIAGDSFASFAHLVDKAIEMNVPMIGAGDLIDRQRNSSDPISWMVREMRRLGRAKLKLYFVQGQHEMQKKPWFAACLSAKHIHRQVVDLDGVGRVYGIDFQPHGKLEAELDLITEEVDLLVVHQVWGEFMGSVASPQGMLGNLPEHVNMVLTGDFHKRDIKTIRNAGGKAMTVLSPGSTCMQDISEPPGKQFFVLRDDGSVASHSIPTRGMIDWDVMTMAEDVDDFASRIDDELGLAVERSKPFPDKPLLRVKYASRLKDVRHRVERMVGDRAHLFFKEIPPEKKEVEQRRQRREEHGGRHASTLESELAGYLAEREQEHLEDPLRRLLEAQDPVTEMALIRKEALADADK